MWSTLAVLACGPRTTPTAESDGETAEATSFVAETGLHSTPSTTPTSTPSPSTWTTNPCEGSDGDPPVSGYCVVSSDVIAACQSERAFRWWTGEGCPTYDQFVGGGRADLLYVCPEEAGTPAYDGIDLDVGGNGIDYGETASVRFDPGTGALIAYGERIWGYYGGPGRAICCGGRAASGHFWGTGDPRPCDDPSYR